MTTSARLHAARSASQQNIDAALQHNAAVARKFLLTPPKSKSELGIMLQQIIDDNRLRFNTCLTGWEIRSGVPHPIKGKKVK